MFVKPNFLAYPASIGGPSLALHRLIQDLGWQVPCTYPILCLKFSQSFLGWQEDVQIVSPNFQNKLEHMM
jgi:hypothetical protein